MGKDSLRHGHGMFTWEDGRRYVGQWVKDQEHGRGVWISPKGERKEGVWNRGSFSKWITAKDDENFMASSDMGLIHPGGTLASAQQGNPVARGNQSQGYPAQGNLAQENLAGGTSKGTGKGKQANAPLSAAETQKCILAFKDAVQPQVEDYKNNRRLQLVSALSGKHLSFEDAMVQHVPIPLEDLVNDFLKEDGMKLESVQLQKKPGVNSFVLEDQGLLQRWLMYHL